MNWGAWDEQWSTYPKQFLWASSHYYNQREWPNILWLIFQENSVFSLTCHPWSSRLRSTARSHITASPAWKSRSFRHRSCRNIPKHFSSSDVEAWNEEYRTKLHQSMWRIKKSIYVICLLDSLEVFKSASSSAAVTKIWYLLNQTLLIRIVLTMEGRSLRSRDGINHPTPKEWKSTLNVATCLLFNLSSTTSLKVTQSWPPPSINRSESKNSSQQLWWKSDPSL